MLKPVIGFIGLGLMGDGFARRLLATGHTVIGHDIAAAKVAAAAALGVVAADNAAAVAARSDIVLTCLPTTQDLDAVALGAAGVASAGRLDGKILVDHSTAEIQATKRIAHELMIRCGMDFVDAPVSGGPAAAAAGTLAIMAGGADAAIARVRPTMEDLGRFTHMGGVGAGQATKLVNQTLVLTNYCVMAEALRLAEAFGVDAAKIPQALSTGHAGSNLLPVLFERMIARDFAPKGYARQVLKDLEMLNDAARSEHLAMPMSAQALTLFRMLVARGDGERDGAAVVELLPQARRS